MIVAALYIDPRGPYPKLPNVDAWDEAHRKGYKKSGCAVPEGIKVCSATQRRRTPPDFAALLLEIARRAKVTS